MVRYNDHIDDVGKVASLETGKEIVEHGVDVANSLTDFRAVGTIKMTVLVDVRNIRSDELRSGIGDCDNTWVIICW